MEKVRILHVVPNMQSGGLEAFIMNLYRNIDKQKIQFDFLVHYKEKKFYDDEIEKLGGKIHRFSLRDDNNIIKYIFELNSFFKNHKEYKIVHCHMSSIGALVFFIAKLNGINVRIAHSHNSDTEKNLKGFIKSLLIKPYKYFSTVNFACSDLAGKYLYKKKKFVIIPNSIDVEKFRYNEKIRRKIRKELNCSDKFLIGHIGRFELQKNHEFLIDIFDEICKCNKNAVLLLIGDGKLHNQILKKVKDLNLQDNVKFLGIRKDVNELYQAMDVFLFPSLYEGLPVVGVEAQCAGLKCVFSDTITREIKITNSCFFLSLSDRIEKWRDEVLKNNKIDRDEQSYILEQSNFNIKNSVKYIENFYINSIKEGE